MTNKIQKYDLLERTEKFGKEIILFAKIIPKNCITIPIISQFIRSGTSVGANYHEADNAESKSDFIHKISISKKEAKETLYWANMIITTCPELKNKALLIYQEAKELHLIFNAIINKLKMKIN